MEFSFMESSNDLCRYLTMPLQHYQKTRPYDIKYAIITNDRLATDSIPILPTVT